MHQILEKREEIYNYFQQSTSCKKFFFAPVNADRYAAYYTSMYLIQDTAESLLEHRKRDFSKFPTHAYIEFWGVMQALIIQQDSLCELHRSITKKLLHPNNFRAWKKICRMRNTSTGHPARTRSGARTFIGRDGLKYKKIKYEKWTPSAKASTHKEFDLGAWIDKYEIEAENVLSEILAVMKRTW